MSLHKYDIKTIKASISLESIALQYGIHVKPSGSRRLIGLCPFHKEQTPSFTLYPSTKSWYCYGCHKGGDALSLLQLLTGQTFLDVLQDFSQGNSPLPSSSVVQSASRKADPILSKHRLALYTRASHRYAQQLYETPSALVYLRKRGIAPDIAQQFQIGFADGVSFPSDVQAARDLDGAITYGLLNRRYRDFLVGRITIPEIRHGKVVQIIGRSLPGKHSALPHHKYLGTAGFKGLLGWGHAITHHQEHHGILVVEGAIDYVIAASWNLPVLPVALLSTGASRRQKIELQTLATYLSCSRVILFLDNDPPGQLATPILAQQFQTDGLSVTILPPLAEDINDIGDLGMRSDGRARFLEHLATHLMVKEMP
jgi:DNA primase